LLQLDWESEAMVEKISGRLGHGDRQVTNDLERFKG
jgi:hypothetical protein